MFTVSMYCTRMMARGIRVGLVIDCTSLDLEDFETLPITASNSMSTSVDPRVRYFHNPSEWDDYDVEYHRLVHPKNVDRSDESTTNKLLAPQVLPEFCNVVSKFLQRSRGKDAISHVAIFDSRGGLGAAAYLIGGYMCQMMKAPVHAALQALKEGTPPQPSDTTETSDGEKGMSKWGLCDPRLVQDLQTRFVGRVEIRMDGRRPSWWYAVEDHDEDNTDGNDNDEPQRKKRKTEDREIVIPSCSVSKEDDKIQTTNHNTQQYQDVATNLENPDIKPTNKLPEGWVVVWSKSQKRWYYFHKITNKSVWDIKQMNIKEVG